MSSVAGTGPAGGSTCAASSRPRRDASARAASRNLRRATVASQPLGSPGGSSAHTRTASTRASCTAITVGVRVRSRASSTLRHSVMVGGGARNGLQRFRALRGATDGHREPLRVRGAKGALVSQTQPRRIAAARSAPGAAGGSKPCPRTGVGFEAWATHPNAGDRAALRRADARPAAGPAPRPRSAESSRSRSASPTSGSR